MDLYRVPLLSVADGSGKFKEKADGRITRARRAATGLCFQEETTRRILRRAQTQQEAENKGSSGTTLTKPQHKPQEGETATNLITSQNKSQQYLQECNNTLHPIK